MDDTATHVGPDSMDRAAIVAAVAELLADSLAIDAATIQPDSRLIDDLGMDSLDFVELVFSLERRFQVKMRSAELDTLLRAEFDPAQLLDGKYLVAAEVTRFTEWLPQLAHAPDTARIAPADLYGYITVESLARLVERRM